MSASDVLPHARQVQGLVELAQAAGLPSNASDRCWRPAWTSCSRDSTRRRRSAAATSAAITAPIPPAAQPAREVTS